MTAKLRGIVTVLGLVVGTGLLYIEGWAVVGYCLCAIGGWNVSALVREAEE